jgi:hypothetical protein
MAFEGIIRNIPGVEAGEDLSAAQYLFGVINTTGKVVKNTVLGGYVDGVIQDKPISGQAVAFARDCISKVVCGGTITNGDRVMSDATGRAITVSAGATSASKRGAVGNYILAPASTIVLNTDAGVDATVTWNATAGYKVDTTTYPVADQTGLTLNLSINGGPTQVITFGACTTAAQAIAQINAQVVGASVSADTTHVRVTSDVKGTGSSVVVVAGGTCGLTWNASVAGTGDVVDITKVTPTEVKTRIEAGSIAHVTVNTDGSFTIVSPTTTHTSSLNFKSGAALSPLGLSVEVLTGADSGRFSCGRANEAGTVGAIIAVNLTAPVII